MNKKKIQKWNLAFMAVCTMVGVLLGLTLIYIVKGQFNFSVLLGALTASAILIIINVIKVHLKKDRTPETDERTVKNLLKFYVYSSHIFLGLLFVALGIITLVGIENISITYLWILIIAYLWISGIGALVVSRR
ncbi:hypothetical protein [Ornithinibacillus halophilus]|uniref:DUF2178 domain-containing protein n=1 Tax=Ornithinibacillus halophilus TaxID=930117 RepID=A0A1M5M1W0_9BACI|nr:hypothetical protein [Ornithinibacillus halophilus]SHG71297.1 hypothetical protein SAMN05216225_105310 [Ornithinibacillus halophilus]